MFGMLWHRILLAWRPIVECVVLIVECQRWPTRANRMKIRKALRGYEFVVIAVARDGAQFLYRHARLVDAAGALRRLEKVEGTNKLVVSSLIECQPTDRDSLVCEYAAISEAIKREKPQTLLGVPVSGQLDDWADDDGSGQ